jgi:hypothetical protein
MPQWAGSCWYYLRFIDPANGGALVDKEKEKYWMPVDMYVGGAEHAVLHLLYARFWHKVGGAGRGECMESALSPCSRVMCVVGFAILWVCLLHTPLLSQAVAGTPAHQQTCVRCRLLHSLPPKCCVPWGGGGVLNSPARLHRLFQSVLTSYTSASCLADGVTAFLCAVRCCMTWGWCLPRSPLAAWCPRA